MHFSPMTYHCAIYPEVSPWTETAITSMESSRKVFSPPEVDGWTAYKFISVLEVYQPAKTVLDSLTDLSKALISADGEGNSVQNLHQVHERTLAALDIFQAGMLKTKCM